MNTLLILFSISSNFIRFRFVFNKYGLFIARNYTWKPKSQRHKNHSLWKLNCTLENNDCLEAFFEVRQVNWCQEKCPSHRKLHPMNCHPNISPPGRFTKGILPPPPPQYNSPLKNNIPEICTSGTLTQKAASWKIKIPRELPPV